jgi:YfiH family protein
MRDELQVEGWAVRGIPHGFAPADTAVAAGLALVRVKQVHGDTLLWVDTESPSPAGNADGLVTQTPGIAIAVATADCVPILLTDPRGEQVAAVHAGWRGTLADIAGRAVRMLTAGACSPASLQAAIGPSIGPCCFEVEADFEDRFTNALGSDVRSCWQDGRPGHGRLDLRALNRLLLMRAGLPDHAIFDIGPCTFCGDGGFASWRRDGARAGRQLSWIGRPA